MLVDHAAVKQALERVDGTVPDHPSALVTLGEPDALGLAEMTISGDPYARPESVLRSLGFALPPEGQVTSQVRPAASQQMLNEEAAAAVVSSEPKPRPKRKPATPKPRYGREQGGS